MSIKEEAAKFMGLMLEWRDAYTPEIFKPIEPNEADVSRDRVSAQMGRHILNKLITRFDLVLEEIHKDSP